MPRSNFFAQAAACLISAFPLAVSAQQLSLVNAPVSGQPKTEAVDDRAEPSAAAVVTVPAVKQPKAITARWLDLKTLAHTERYRSVSNQGGWHLFEDGQQRSLVVGQVKLDAAGRYGIGFRASSGRYFNWAYADFAGRGFTGRLYDQAHYSYAGSYNAAELQEIYASYAADPQNVAVFATVFSNGWEFYMRELYFEATPVNAVTVEFGSFGVERGLATEITTTDDDGYLSGERIRVHAPQKLYFDEVGYTNAFYGDRATPNLFKRGGSLAEFNYRQAFAKKQVTPRVGFSVDYTWQTGTHTLRQASRIGVQETKVLDKVRVELYQRLNTVNLQGLDVHGGSGFAIVGERNFGKKWFGDAGFAAIDKDYSVYTDSRYFHAYGFSLNGDAYGQGKRPFVHASYKLNPVVTAFGFYTHAVGDRVLTINKQGLNGGLEFDFKALANLEKKIF